MEKLKKNKNGNKRMNKQKRTMREKKNKERKLIRFNIKVIIIHKKKYKGEVCECEYIFFQWILHLQI